MSHQGFWTRVFGGLSFRGGNIARRASREASERSLCESVVTIQQYDVGLRQAQIRVDNLCHVALRDRRRGD